MPTGTGPVGAALRIRHPDDEVPPTPEPKAAPNETAHGLLWQAPDSDRGASPGEIAYHGPAAMQMSVNPKKPGGNCLIDGTANPPGEEVRQCASRSA